MATTSIASCQAASTAPASTRRHQRYGPPPGPAAPHPRTGQRNTCASGPRAAGTHRSPRRPAGEAASGGARRSPGAPPGQEPAPIPGPRVQRTRHGSPARTRAATRQASATVQPRSATSAPSSPRSRLISRHRGGHRGQRLGERHAGSTPGWRTSTAACTRPPVISSQAPAQVTGPGQRVLMHPARDRPAVRARSRARVIGDHPDSERAVGLPAQRRRPAGLPRRTAPMPYPRPQCPRLSDDHEVFSKIHDLWSRGRLDHATTPGIGPHQPTRRAHAT